jgi:rare lipoprotein A
MTHLKKFWALGAIVILLTGCTEAQYGAHIAKQVSGPAQVGKYKVGTPYYIDGTQYFPVETFEHSETGIASWYGPGFHGKQTANGEIYDQNDLTAAHRTLQMPSLVRVTNLENGRALVLRVNDRGPYSKGRVIDVSSRAADLLGMKGKGTAKVRVDVLAEESRRIAEDARLGKDTRGYEVALNSRGNVEVTPPGVPSSTPVASDATQTAVQVASVQSEPLQPIKGHVTSDGRFMPDGIVTIEPVKSSNIFVQAGAFSDQSNAVRLSQNLATVGSTNVYPTNVAGQDFYRVRVGPFNTVEEADAALSRIISQGSSNAKIIVE